MSRVTCQVSISLDGFAAGPHQSLEEPLGVGGERLHEWFFGPAAQPSDVEVVQQLLRDSGAFIMGRRMFGGGPGPWDPTWQGWWGDDPPYHAPVFVLTHHERDPLPLQGGTTFTFVTGGVHEALERARAVAGEQDVAIAGGAQTVQQFLVAGLVDELWLHIAPVLLGSGERLLDGVGDLALEQVEVTSSPMATHIRYRVLR